MQRVPAPLRWPQSTADNGGAALHQSGNRLPKHEPDWLSMRMVQFKLSQAEHRCWKAKIVLHNALLGSPDDYGSAIGKAIQILDSKESDEER